MKAKNDSEANYAVVRVRGTANLPREKEDALRVLCLTKPNHCVVIPKNPTSDGMLKMAKDYVTWGEVSEEVKKKLAEKSLGKKVIRLHPPRKGYGRKGVSLSFKQGGALGYRKEKINDLITRMIQ